MAKGPIKNPKEYKRKKQLAVKKRIEELGYYHSFETRCKIGEGRLGEKNPFFGRNHTEEAKRKMGRAKGKYHNFGKHLSKETIQKISSALTGRQFTPKHLVNMRLIRNTEKYRKRCSELMTTERISQMLKGLRNRPTSYEKRIIVLVQKYDLKFDYTGDGSYWIKRKDGKRMNPDFVHKNKPIVIETYCRYRHKENYENERYNLMKEVGFLAIFLNEKDLFAYNWEDVCIKKIKIGLND